jgi:hypothetical protein
MGCPEQLLDLSSNRYPTSVSMQNISSFRFENYLQSDAGSQLSQLRKRFLSGLGPKRSSRTGK